MQTKIDHIVAMGFNRAEVETCLRTSSNGVMRAEEFLRRIERSDPALTKLRHSGTCLALWQGETGSVQLSDSSVRFRDWSTVRGAEFHRSELRIYYEITVEQTCPCPQFGFCTSEFSKQLSYSSDGCGDDFHSWAWDGSRQLFFWCAETFVSQVHWKSGDCLGFEIDFISNTTKLSVNGIFVHEHEFSSSTHTLYACMSARKSQVFVNFGWNIPEVPFSFPPNWLGPSGVALYPKEIDYGFLSQALLRRALSLNTSITSLNMSVSDIGPDVASSLLPALMHLSSMTYLNLNGLESAAAFHLCSAFPYLTSLTHLDLSDNILTADDGARICAAAAAAGMTRLNTLNLECGRFSAFDVVGCDMWMQLNLPRPPDHVVPTAATDCSLLVLYLMSSDMAAFAEMNRNDLPPELLQRIRASDTALTKLQMVLKSSVKEAGCKLLVRALSLNTCITSLDLFQEVFGSTEVCVIFPALTHLTAMTHLNLSNTSLGSSGALHLCAALTHLTAMTHLNLSNTSLGSSGALHLCAALTHLTAMTHLYLVSNHLTAVDGALICVAAAKAGMTSLKTLDLGKNPSEDHPFSSWDVSRCKSWKEINPPHVCNDYFFKIADSSALFQYIMSNDRPGFVATFFSSFQLAGFSKEMLQRIERSDPELVSIKVDDLYLNHSRLGPKSTRCAILARALSMNTCITSLNLRDADLGPGCDSLFDALSHLTTLTRIDLGSNRLAADNGALICAAAAAACMTFLKELDLGYNDFDAWSVVQCETWKQLKLPQPPDEIVTACKCKLIMDGTQETRRRKAVTNRHYIVEVEHLNVAPILSYLLSEDKTPSYEIRMFVIGESTVPPHPTPSPHPPPISYTLLSGSFNISVCRTFMCSDFIFVSIMLLFSHVALVLLFLQEDLFTFRVCTMINLT
jgi:Ran GTPase-activating protein (RanGAP) involved in mRNA processing and transport